MQSMVEKLVEKGRKQGHDEGRLVGVRSSLRRVLALRKLVPSRTEDAQIVAEALGAGATGAAPARRRRR